ncbi:hypothetical protein [Gemmobacter denitrificans]|uniref:Uncharacterized protein n=1 Tax=Gemmobacter denitrificans TaxID=3123040 RepID=A0ABU8BSI0_9RHOB
MRILPRHLLNAIERPLHDPVAQMGRVIAAAQADFAETNTPRPWAAHLTAAHQRRNEEPSE